MTRTFIEVPLFTKRWKEIGLDDEELQALQIMLLKDPESGPIMEGPEVVCKVSVFGNCKENPGELQTQISHGFGSHGEGNDGL